MVPMTRLVGWFCTDHEPDRLVERGQMSRGYLVVCLHGNMTIGLRMPALRAMMKMHASRRSWLLMMTGHGQRRGRGRAKVKGPASVSQRIGRKVRPGPSFLQTL